MAALTAAPMKKKPCSPPARIRTACEGAQTSSRLESQKRGMIR
jgi:hypothetical protein